MLKSVVSVFTIFLPCLLSAQESDAPPMRTEVRWEVDTLDFGSIEEGTLVLDSFVLHNTGNAPYVIRDVKTTCDCTLIKYPKAPVPPGGRAAVRFEFDSNVKNGYAHAGLIVYDNSAPNSRSILYFKALIYPRRQVKIIRNR